MIKRLLSVFILSQMLLGCSFFVGLLHMQEVEIVAWSPDRELIPAEQVSNITVTFSSSMNRVLAEDAFSLNRENRPTQGHFSWREADTILVYTPEVPLAGGCRFTIEVADTAEDLYGNSLSEAFDFYFSTAEELLPPEVVLYEPADGAQVSSARMPIRIVFSESIEPSSFYLGFSLFPEVQGGISWSPGGEEVEFLPLVDYQSGQSYEVVLGREISAHTLRHSWATEQIKRGQSLKAVSLYLGHASTSITADLYVHDTLDADAAALSFS